MELRYTLNVLLSSIHSLYSTPSSLMNIFCNSISLCNFFATYPCSMYRSSAAVVVVSVSMVA